MLYLLAVICPPAAALAAAGPRRAAANTALTLLLYLPGLVHALAAVDRHYTDRRNEALLRHDAPARDPAKYYTLPSACSLCGSCTDVCPVKIDIHHQLLTWRRELAVQGHLPWTKRMSMKMATIPVFFIVASLSLV